MSKDEANATEGVTAPSGVGVTPAAEDAPDRDFDRVPPETPAALAAAAPAADVAAATPAQEAAEAAARANAARARERLLREVAARQAAAPPGAHGEEAALAAAARPFLPKRGAERWPVKTVTDGDRDRIAPGVRDTTVEDLLLLERPADMPLTRAVARYQARRAAPAETTRWRVEAVIIAHKWEVDGDYHIVIQSPASGYTMIVEAPQDGTGADGQPFVDPASPVKAAIDAVRAKLRARLNPQPSFGNAHLRVRLTGLGFFDILHGQTGVAETNAIELHPLTDVEFL